MSDLALLFPGQGAQAPGMGRDFAEQSPEARALFERAGATLGWDLARVCFEGPAEELTRSDRAQPAIFVVSAAAWEALRRARPDARVVAAAGLSSGEWTALYAAGVLTFEDTLRVLEARGRYMQEACEARPGGMLSVIGLDRAALERICAASGAEIANLNSPEQTVLSGPKEAIAAAERLAGEAGARCVRLNVAGAFHSSLMQPAADRLRNLLAGIEFRAPAFPVWSNVTGAPHGAPADIREAMVRQVTGSVRWVDCVTGIRRAAPAAKFVECGPGRVLTGLLRRIDKSAPAANLSGLSDLQRVAESL